MSEEAEDILEKGPPPDIDNKALLFTSPPSARVERKQSGLVLRAPTFAPRPTSAAAFAADHLADVLVRIAEVEQDRR